MHTGGRRGKKKQMGASVFWYKISVLHCSDKIHFHRSIAVLVGGAKIAIDVTVGADGRGNVGGRVMFLGLGTLGFRV